MRTTSSMDQKDRAILEALERRGVIVFANGKVQGQVACDWIGTPICVSCRSRVIDGIMFVGDGSLCMTCLNSIRRTLAGVLGLRKSE
jgi:hypothetical protein